MSFDKLPDGWQLIPLEDAMDAIIDYRGKTPKKTESGIPLITAKIVKGGYILEPFEFIAVDNYDSWMVRGLPQIGDVVLTTEAPLGETAQLTNANVALAQRIVTLRGKNGLLDNDYLLCALQSDFVQHQLESRSSGSTVKGIKQSELRKVSLPVPPLDEQQKIARILKSLSNKLVCNTQTNQTLEEMAQAIFKSWFVDFDPVKAKMNGEQPEGMDAATASLFPEKLVESELGLIPEGWEVSTLSSLIKLTGGGTPKRSEETYWNGDIPWFSVRDVPSGSNVFVVDTDEKITELGLNKSSTKLLPKGTTIITARGTVGKLALVGTDMCMNQSCYGIRGKEVGDFYNYFNLNEAVSTLQRNTHGAVFDTITTKTFDTYSMAFSGIELANKFDALVAPLLQKIEANVRQNIELSTLRDTLLPKLLSGELIPSSMAEEV
ncbi:restriction endonuclease subunit S [Photobacterium damselae]|uniref:restriction endonuclease subunit S n=1 Tax=Photobacterium damselae TaxID=38293 RepID=UPI0040694CE0